MQTTLPPSAFLVVLGCVATTCGLQAFANAQESPPAATPVISEVMWMGSDRSTSDEWLEIAGRAGMTDLSGWTITSLNGSGQEAIIARFATGALIGSGQFLVIARQPAAESRLASEPFLVSSALVLPNTKLLVRLRDAAGAIVDQVDDGVGAPFAGMNASGTGARASMERIDLLRGGTESDNWKTSTRSEGWDEGIPIFGTPGTGPVPRTGSSVTASSLSSSALSSTDPILSSSSLSSAEVSSIPLSSSVSSSVQSSSVVNSSSSSSLRPLRLSEVLADPAGSEQDQWIEIVNPSQVAIDLAGWSLQYGSRTFTFPAGTIISPGEYRSFRRTVTGFALDHAGGDIQLREQGILVDFLAFPKTTEGVSAGRVPDSSEVRPFCVPTEGKPNDRESAWDAQWKVQSGEVKGTGKVSVNLEITATVGSPAGMECKIDFDDGIMNETCNPPSHTFSKPGEYLVNASITNYCGSAVTRTISVLVESGSSATSSIAASSLSSSRSSHRTSSSHPVKNPQKYSLMNPVVVAALPNPVGTDNGHEWVELRNDGSVPLELDGWLLLVGTRKEVLSGTIAMGETRRYTLRTVTLPNTGGVILLLDPSGLVRSELHWTKAGDGAVIRRLPTRTNGRLPATVLKFHDDLTFDIETIGAPLERFTVLPIGISLLSKKNDQYERKSGGLNLREIYRGALNINEKVELEFDTDVFDKSGNILAYVYTESGQLIQELLLMQGSVQVGPDEFSRRDRFLTFQSESEATSVSKEQAGSASTSIGSTQIRLVEVYAAPLTGNASVPKELTQEWIELYNAGDTQVALDGWVIREQVGASTRDHILKKITIGSKEYLLLFSQKLGLKLNDDGEEIALIGPGGSPLIVYKYGKLKKGQSYVFLENGQGCIQELATPRLSNKCVQEAAVDELLEHEPVDESFPELPSETGSLMSLLPEQRPISSLLQTGELPQKKESSGISAVLAAISVFVGPGAFVGWKLLR